MKLFMEYLKYVVLSMLGILGQSCYILADTYFVANGVGTDGLAALNLAIPVFSFISGTGLMLGMGGAAKYAVYKSQNNQEQANKAFTTAFASGLGFSMVFVLAGLLFPGQIAGLLGADAATFEMSKTYITWILLFAPFFISNIILGCFVRNDGAPSRSMAATLLGSLSNIILDYVFIYPLGMGIFGAVLATGIAPVVSILILSPYLLQGRAGFKLKLKLFSGRWLPGIAALGIPSLVTELSSGIVIIVFNIIILGIAGNTGVAAYGIIANVSIVVIALFTGIAQGIQPLISRSHGTGDKDKIRKILRYAVITTVLLSAAVYGALFAFAGGVTSLFNGESNSQLQQIAVMGIKIYFVGAIPAGLNIVISMYFTSREKPGPAQLISLLRGFLLVIPLSFLLSEFFGMTGVWATFPAAELLTFGVTLLCILQSNRKSDIIVEKKREKVA